MTSIMILDQGEITQWSVLYVMFRQKLISTK
jgi:hypothetical protein